MQIPQFEVYGDYSSRGYGSHALRFWDANGNVFWFSYETLVAFKKIGGERVVRKNDWSTTTGKHLNAIDGGDKEAKAARVTKEVFEVKLKEAFPD